MSIPNNQIPRPKMDPENWTVNFRDYLLQHAISKVSDYQAAEDLVQETFVSAWKARENFRGDCSEKTYLCGILRNKIIDFYRSKGRKPTVIASQLQPEGEDGDSMDWLENARFGDSKEDPILLAERKDFKAALEKAVDNLPPKMAEVFSLWMIDDLSTKEVTERLSISESNLWVSIHRAKKLLRAELASEWNGLSLAGN